MAKAMGKKRARKAAVYRLVGPGGDDAEIGEDPSHLAVRRLVQLFVGLADGDGGAQLLLHPFGALDESRESGGRLAAAAHIGAGDVAAIAAAGGAGVEEERVGRTARRPLLIM